MMPCHQVFYVKNAIFDSESQQGPTSGPIDDPGLLNWNLRQIF